ncbi:uncharacterized protein LOC114879778 isoform X1 [Osmia bicornis bicornis]|uniref:uncharacterized protein LOC114879778 isoform X1 n=1 Tax=Osmia bicornis bicornis TaxID=1437191 RepID=UPI0010F45D39|nr:uncharacterized protein LOC114879778 isoform X1 [Osmia bicornis bicornis]XP_029050868.1 uncharacterized protein LOC114879778 isoform X1 [Osmia bicornis bicornis]XP_046144290.1 uncharacterized protein LOC114879778 isoform X1 [Osmia bicornis bicornis]
MTITRDKFSEDANELLLYFAIAGGVTAGALLLLFILVFVLFVKVNRLSTDGKNCFTKSMKLFRSNQLNRQTSMMADFCYTNPTIVPGELLSRRGFSMYSGSENFNDDFGTKKDYHYGTYHEARSKF